MAHRLNVEHLAERENAKSGKLSPTGKQIEVPVPVYLKIVGVE